MRYHPYLYQLCTQIVACFERLNDIQGDVLLEYQKLRYEDAT